MARMTRRALGRASGVRILHAAVVLLGSCLVGDAQATLRYGDIQISGNLETQELFRMDQSVDSTFSAFNLIQQRNVFRLQYEHDLVKNGELLGMLTIPGVRKANLFTYYRFVYDSAYDIEPGPFQKASDGSRGGGFHQFSGAERHAIALENSIREIFLDLELSRLPVSFRIGRQQIVWGNTVAIRAVDSINALDLNWHFTQEAGILGRVGFSELRVPAWAAKMLVRLPTVGPFADNYLEAFDIPFEFRPTRVRFLPRPWSLPLRSPFRPGVVAAVDTPAGPQFVQVCYDSTGDRSPTDDDGNPLTPSSTIDFSEAAETGLCPTRGLQTSSLSEGIYDAHDPRDVNQFGVRLGGLFSPIGLGFALSYKHQRHVLDATGGTAAKSHSTLVTSSTQSTVSFVELDPHSTTDPMTGATTDTIGFVRIPIEFYYPYISVFGLTLDYADDFTGAVWDLEVAANKGVPLANLNPDADFPGMRRTWELEIGLLMDRPTWIRFLNPRATWLLLVQGNLSFVPFVDKVRCTGTPPEVTCTGGDVGSPSSNSLPGLFRDEATLDQRVKYEYLTVVAMSTFYRGGSIAPLIAWISNWNHAPAMEWQAFLQFLPRPSLILEPGVRIFWTNGRVVDDRYGVFRHAGRSEAQFKMTYQF